MISKSTLTILNYSKLLSKMNFISYNQKSSLNFKTINKYLISTQIIKSHTKQLNKANPSLLKQYPKTFQQKAIVLNHPNMIQAIQIIEFGVQYKPGKKYLFLALLIISAFTYFQQTVLPERIIDGYFAVSTQMKNGYNAGYFLAPFTYEKPFIIFLPLMAVIYQMSKFIKPQQIASLVILNMVTNGILANYLVNQRVKQYEVWDQERIFYGQANLLSLGCGFWTILGLKNGFTALKSRIMLKAIPGAGILRSGLPIAYILSVYIGYFIYTYMKKQSKNNEVALLAIINSIIWGIIMKRYLKLIVK